MGFARLFGGHDQLKTASKDAALKPAGEVLYWKQLPRRYEQLKRKAAELRRRREQQEKRAKYAAQQQERQQQRLEQQRMKEQQKKAQQKQPRQPVALGKNGNEGACMEDLLSPRSVCDSARAMEQAGGSRG